jgi:serine protease Do
VERDEFGVRSAFRAATSGPARCTVKIICDGRSAALGAIVSPDGYIVTKASELYGRIVCQSHGIARRLEASIVGIDEEHDVALLKIRANNLAVIEWSRAVPPPVGSWLATPASGEVPVSIGVVSVEPRQIKRRVAALGIILRDADHGARVYQVVPGSGAGKAGIKRDDIITHLQGKRVDSRDALVQAITQFCPGDKVRVQALRGGKAVTTDAILSDLAELSGEDENATLEKLGGPLSKRRAGFPVVIQHDTVLQPNQCGGPLVNLDGQAVGINIARASRVASYAIPADVVQSLIEKLQTRHTVSTTSVD